MKYKLSLCSLVATIAVLLFSGCSSVKCVGRYFDPTSGISIFYTQDEIGHPFRIVGHA